MSNELAEQDQATAAVGIDAVTPKPGKGTRIGATILLVLIFSSLLWYFAADRLTPYSSQARVQAFVVPVAAEAAGKVLAVHVKNNDDVQLGQPLFDIDPSQYQIALQRSRADYESVRHSVNASVATVEAARASLQAAQANRAKADKDATRQEALYSRGSRRHLGCAGWRSRRPPGSRRAAWRRPPRPTCARPRKPPATPVTTMPSCAARVRRSRRPNWLWRARRWSPPAAVWWTDLHIDARWLFCPGRRTGDDPDRNP